MNRCRVAIALALLTLFAGCNAPPPSEPGGDRPTLTPVSVPESTPESVAQVPGMRSRQVSDERALVAAHRSGLNATSYRLVSERHITGPNGTLNRVRTTATVAASRDAYRVTRIEQSDAAWYTAASFARIDIWYRAPVVRNRFLDGDGIARYWGSDNTQQGGPVRNPTRAGFVADALVSVRYRVVNVSRTGGVNRYRLVAARGVSEPASAPALLVDVRNVSLIATVRDDGVVLGYELQYDATFTDQNVSVIERYGVDQLGTATVEQPDWLSEANETVSD